MFSDGRDEGSEQAYDEYVNTLPGYVDFNVPWNVNLQYQFNYSKPRVSSTLRQTLRVSGNVSLTENWKISVSSSYDFEENKLAATTVNIHRDLHCWEMAFNWVPIGNYQSYNFRINVKSAILQDLKYTKQKSWRDNF
jgi:lipopolysaccharide assembly outer membrane protein LptD (OstA)